MKVGPANSGTVMESVKDFLAHMNRAGAEQTRRHRKFCTEHGLCPETMRQQTFGKIVIGGTHVNEWTMRCTLSAEHRGEHEFTKEWQDFIS